MSGKFFENNTLITAVSRVPLKHWRLRAVDFVHYNARLPYKVSMPSVNNILLNSKLTSFPPVERISFASYQFLTENVMQYSGKFFRSGLLPYCASSAAARSRASGS